MSRRRTLLAGMAAGLLAAQMATAQGADPVTQLVTTLGRQGFSVSSVERTWLGRVRIVAASDDRVREIVVDPRNGVILRDLIRWIDEEDGDRGFGSGRSGSGSGGSGGGVEDDDDDDDDDEDDEEDDDEDDDDEEDNSGPGGGGNSGSGGGGDNSGSGGGDDEDDDDDDD